MYVSLSVCVPPVVNMGAYHGHTGPLPTALSSCRQWSWFKGMKAVWLYLNPLPHNGFWHPMAHSLRSDQNGPFFDGTEGSVFPCWDTLSLKVSLGRLWPPLPPTAHCPLRYWYLCMTQGRKLDRQGSLRDGQTDRAWIRLIKKEISLLRICCFRNLLRERKNTRAIWCLPAKDARGKDNSIF